MPKVTIISHLTPLEWKLSWNDKVIEDTRENMKEYQSSTCFWGHFSTDRDFTICHHREFEVKGMSMGLYFNGHIEADEKGSCITGKFTKKWSANLFLIAGAIICLLAMLGGILYNESQMIIVGGVLLIIVVVYYFMRPSRGQQRIIEELKKISFDDAYAGKDRYHHAGKTKTAKAEAKKNRSMKEKARVVIEENADGIVEEKGDGVEQEEGAE